MYLSKADKLNVDLNGCKDIDFYILRSRTVLNAIRDLFFSKKKDAKIPKLNFNESEMRSLLNSYVGVRLFSVGKGTIDKFSLLYDTFGQTKSGEVTSIKEALNEENVFNSERFVVNKLINCYRKQAVGELESSGKVTAGANINKLLRRNFNKNELLKNEASFFEMNQELLDSLKYRVPVGFVSNGGYTLVAGGCAANAFILTKHLIDLLSGDRDLDYNQRTTVSYKTPSADLIRHARITGFYI
jgi:hypothetical protein